VVKVNPQTDCGFSGRQASNGEELEMTTTKREILDNIPLILVAAMVLLGLLSFFSVVLT
jgi:hypothetical protein